MIVTRPESLRGGAQVAACLAVGLGAVAWTAPVAYGPLRIGLIGLAVLQVVCWWAARLAGRLRAVDGARAARVYRLAGFALAACVALLLIADFRASTAGLAQKAYTGVPLCAVLLVLYLAAWVLLTARRAALAPRVLIAADGCAIVACSVWLIPVLIRPPLPREIQGAVLAIVAAGVVAALAVVPRAGSGREVLTAALGACASAALLVFACAEALVRFTTRWVPEGHVPNVAATTRLANDRAGAEDPYIAVLPAGALVAALLVVLLVLGGCARARAATEGRPVTG